MFVRAALVVFILLSGCQSAPPAAPTEPAQPSSRQAWRSFPKAYQSPSAAKTPGKADSYDDYRLTAPEWYAVTVPPATAFRPFTEWETLRGTLITYSDYLTQDPKISATMTDIAYWGAKGAKMYVVYQSESARNHLLGGLADRGMTEEEIADRVELIKIENQTIWFVDFGPFPLIDPDGNVAFADKRYYHERVHDDALPTRLGQYFGVSSYRFPMSYEWGGFQADDIGDCYSSDRILQIALSQTGQTKADLEKLYADYVGCKQMIWLKSITDDGTGHLDMFFKLADRNTVVHSAYLAPMKMDAVDLQNKKRMEDNIALLEATVLTDGSKLTVYQLPMPNAGNDPEWGKTPRTYVNSHLVNGYNLWPVYSVDKDIEAAALEVWKQAMPEYEHVGILSDEISLLSGTIHCVTRGIPELTYQKWVDDGECGEGTCQAASGAYSGECGADGDCWGPEWICECNACPCEEVTPTPNGCGEVSMEGQCTGTTLRYCEGGAIQQGDCPECCGFDPNGNGGGGWYDCLDGAACGACQDECAAGEEACSAERTHGWQCEDANGDGCLERVYSFCGEGVTCQDDAVCGGEGTVPVEPDAGAHDAGSGEIDAGTADEDAGAPALDTLEVEQDMAVAAGEDTGSAGSGSGSGAGGGDTKGPAQPDGASAGGAGGAGGAAATAGAQGTGGGGCSGSPGSAPLAGALVLLFALLWTRRGPKRGVLSLLLLIALSSSLLACESGEAAPTSPEARLVYVANAGSGTVSVIDLAEGATVASVEVAPEGKGAHGIAITNDGRFVYSGDMESGEIKKIDTTDRTVVKVIPTGASAHGIDITPNGETIFVSGGERVAMISVATDEVIATIPAESPSHIAASPDSSYVYLSNLLTHEVSVISVKDKAIVAAAPVGPSGWAPGAMDQPGSWGPNEVAVSPDGARVYSADYDSGTVTMVDTSDPKAPKRIDSVDVGGTPHGILVTHDGAEVWVTNRGTKEIQVLDAENLSVLKRISLGKDEPNHIVFSDDGTTAYVTATNDDSPKDSLMEIDVASRKVRGAIEVGDSPHEISLSN